jgi:hypothetical protein
MAAVRARCASASSCPRSSGKSAGRRSWRAEAGADEAILVVSPITERSIRRLGEAIAAV